MIPTKEISGKYKVWTCFPYEDNHQVEIYRIDIEPGGEYISGSHGEKTREYLAVSEGEITVECHGNIQQVNKKQVYRFETDQTHIYRNQTDKRASFMCFFVDYR